MKEAAIGKKIRNLRTSFDLTVEDLADRCELSKGFISQLENGKTSVTIETLNDICTALGTTLSDFFKQEKSKKIVFTNGDLNILEEDNYITKWLLPNAQTCDLEPILIKILPGKESEELMPFEGATFGYILKGEVEVNYGKDSYVCKKENTFYTPCNKPFILKNKSQDIVEILWVTTPPAF